MPINPNIALSFKPTYELESPQNILANVMRLKGAEQEQQMNALRMQEAQRGVESQNALNRALSAAYDPTTGRPNVSKATAELAGSGFGGQIPGVLKSEAERVEAENKSQESRSKLLGSKLAQSKDALEQYVKTPEQMRQYNAANIADPVIGEYMRSRGITLDQLNQEVDAVEAAGPQAFNRYLQKQVLGAKEFLKANEGKLYFPQGSDNAYVYNPYEGTVAQVPGLNTGASQRTTPNQQFTQDIAKQNLGFREREVTLKEQEAARKSAGQDLKPVPTAAQKAITGSAAAIDKLDRAIKSIEEGPKEGATGLKGLLPDVALNRLYPEGTEGRANVSDIGSLVMHERSGAAVTASEAPRLKPFIPLITDDKATVLKKLRRMREIQAEEQDALLGTYNPEQGFREFKPASVTKPSAPGAPTVPKRDLKSMSNEDLLRELSKPNG
ncbi:hypothetical protein UFOVP1355_23 [uncultured Caudovirales phage]|uniref:Uncharacterized protein n=1 Tax=uncultured Caudovirales phage TaxID=2100421 RepID=A0A6J5RRU2_9CAUD|nr:hypothetical protein UFOVP1355_23 [uncultured Caudovirales phage]